MSSAQGRSRLIAVAVMTATFLAGLMVGIAVPRVLAKEPEAAARGERRDGYERRNGGRDRHSIFDQLDLSAEQRSQIDSIFERSRREMDAFWQQHGPQMNAIVDSTRADINRVLTEEQRQQMEEFRAQRRQQWERRNGDGRGAPGEPKDRVQSEDGKSPEPLRPDSPAGAEPARPDAARGGSRPGGSGPGGSGPGARRPYSPGQPATGVQFALASASP